MKTTKRKLFVGLTVIAILGAASWVTAANFNNSYELSDLTLENLQMLSQGENVDWEKLKLKQEECTCADGKTGITLKCKSDGDLEQCSQTQQGSKACYKVIKNPFNPRMELCS